MIDFTPIPWPDEIQDYFSEHSAIAWVPGFMHEKIEASTEYVTDIDPDFFYQDIQLRSAGFHIRFKDAPEAGSFMETIIQTMEEEWTTEYRKFAQEHFFESIRESLSDPTQD